MTKDDKTAAGKPLEAQAARPVDLVRYEDGAVVSREVIRKKTGTVTLFAFDEGQGLSEHTAPFDALACLLEGEMQITVSSKRHHLTAGEMILMPADQPHALQALTRCKMMLTMIRS